MTTSATAPPRCSPPWTCSPGKVIGQCLPKHRNTEFLKFLRAIDKQVPRGLDIHMILGHYGTHTHPDVRAWLDRHRRFHLHFTPASDAFAAVIDRAPALVT